LEEKLKVGRKEKDLDLVIEKRREELDLSRFILKVREVEKRSYKKKLKDCLLKEKKLKLKQ
jgi:hypothetical protein